MYKKPICLIKCGSHLFGWNKVKDVNGANFEFRAFIF